MKIEFRSCKVDEGDVLIKFNNDYFIAWTKAYREWLFPFMDSDYDYWKKAK